MAVAKEQIRQIISENNINSFPAIARWKKCCITSVADVKKPPRQCIHRQKSGELSFICSVILLSM